MRNWKPITDQQKNGKTYLVACLDRKKKEGPFLAKWSIDMNHWICLSINCWHYTPTHYDDLEGLEL